MSDENAISRPPDDYCTGCDRHMSRCGCRTVADLAAGGRRARAAGDWESDAAILYESRN